jgi:hypothetical protein
VPGFVSNVELLWRVPDYAANLRRLTSFSRLILFDKRGKGPKSVPGEWRLFAVDRS